MARAGAHAGPTCDPHSEECDPHRHRLRELASNYCSPRATSSARSSCPGLSYWFRCPGNDDVVLRSLLSFCSNVALCAQGLYLLTESRFITRACPDGASGCLDERHG